MNKIIIAPDSFKGTLSAAEICAVMKPVILRHFPECTVAAIPIADGGEGSVECFLTALGGELVQVNCSGPWGTSDRITASYGILPETAVGGVKTAVIEMAAAAGLSLAGEHKDPGQTTTCGAGELIAHAIGRGCRKIILGLGGSCTNDFGCGAASALGVRFLDRDGRQFIPTGASLCNIAHIDTGSANELLGGVEMTVMCDIDNPVYGERGAAYVFAPQKGADYQMTEMLDQGLRHLCGIIKKDLGIDVSELPGGGAAGAMGAGMYAFAGAKLSSGIDTVLDTVGFDEMIKDADIIFTGEGCLDQQSLHGKVISGIGRRARAAGVPVAAIVGGIKDGIDEMYEMGITAAFSINRLPVDLSVSRYHSAENLESVFDNVLRLIKAAGIIHNNSKR